MLNGILFSCFIEMQREKMTFIRLKSGIFDIRRLIWLELTLPFPNSFLLHSFYCFYVNIY